MQKRSCHWWINRSAITISALLVIALIPAAALFPVSVHASTGQGEHLSSDDYDEIDPNLNAISPVPKGRTGLQPDVGAMPSSKEMRIARMQVILDRAGLSPGAINGASSEYLERLLELYRQRTGRDIAKDDQALEAALEASGGMAFQTIELSRADIRGPFVASIPKRIQDQSALQRLSFRNPREALAERHHMDEAFLARLNPGVDFKRAGTRVTVTNIGRYLDRRVGRIHASRNLKQVTAFDATGKILAVYPASIGSRQTPSPTGVFKVRNKAGNPAYTLATDNGFEPIDDGRQVVVAPGPNNPVGIAWIGLSEKTYGIHGTPEPSRIGRNESHGCIRLTNWDALELTRLVSTGVEVVIE